MRVPGLTLSWVSSNSGMFVLSANHHLSTHIKPGDVDLQGGHASKKRKQRWMIMADLQGLCAKTRTRKSTARTVSHRLFKSDSTYNYTWHASTIFVLSSSIPKGGTIFALVTIGGRHNGAASQICFLNDSTML